MDQKKSLLERYGIPINHLDFRYINDCQDPKEMEKILHILRSGEEGYYPDLTQCAEKKLKELKPHSRLFRVEEHIRGRESLGLNEWKPIYDWNHDIKDKDEQLLTLNRENNNNKDPAASSDSHHPAIRKFGRIMQEKMNDDKGKTSSTIYKCENVEAPKSNRITSTDYRKWDQYDADEEVLRMDLAEERIEEEVERKNRLNSRKCKSHPKIEELMEVVDSGKEKVKQLTNIEKEKLSEEYRLRGNEYFRAKEFDNALVEYTKAINVYPEKAVAAYNNRALTYFKQQKFYESLKDCENCLQLEPHNLKGRLRLAEATYACGKRRESYQLYINVLQVDASNVVALKAITELRNMFEDLPPPNATRLTITEEPSHKSSMQDSATTPVALKSQNPQKSTKPNITHTPTALPLKPKTLSKPSTINYDLADLVKPNNVIKNKFIKAAERLGKIPNNTSDKQKVNTGGKQNSKQSKELNEQNITNADVISQLRMPSNIVKLGKDKKRLIEEI